MNISKLEEVNETILRNWGHYGYVTNHRYEVSKNIKKNSFTFCFQLNKLNTPYKKTWVTGPDGMKHLNKIIKEGHSFGAFENNDLTGMIICENRKWNNTLYIENILVSEQYRGKGVGEQLINKIKKHSELNHFRLIELETQNTNVPAIIFYLKQGFEITGVNLKLYNSDNASGEFAFLMTFEK